MTTLARYNLIKDNDDITNIIKQNDLFADIVKKIHDKHKLNISFMIYCFRNSNSKYLNLKYYILDNNFVPKNTKDTLFMLFREANYVFQGFLNGKLKVD